MVLGSYYSYLYLKSIYFFSRVYSKAKFMFLYVQVSLLMAIVAREIASYYSRRRYEREYYVYDTALIE